MAGAGADAVVIGAGVIGLAVARALAQGGREVIVLEREAAIGTHTSARNSEVIHAGIYYPPGSRKARLCVAGRRALYAYAEAQGIAHRRLGKLIVATSPEEVLVLEGYRARAAANGVEALDWLTPEEARTLEPAISCVRALWSPTTGIIDAHGLLRSLRRDAEAAGAAIVTRAPVADARADDGELIVTVGGPAPATVRCRLLVNAAGLWAPAVARTIAGLPPSAAPDAYFARGHYFTLAGPSPFRHLVYPVAVGGGLGIHVTLDLAGAARFGPDIDWIEGVDYRFDEGRAPAFAAAIRRYWPGLPSGALRPGYVGIRPRLGPTGSVHDFVIQGPADHAVPGLVNLFGIESPGLTAALAIADEVAALAAGQAG
jgi:L-2-hydroxyglutarate oxidase LhgO